MAKAKQQPLKNATTVTTTTVTGGGGRRRRRRALRRRAPDGSASTVKTTTVRSVSQRPTRARRNQRRLRLRSRQLGHEVVQTVTATLGTVSANQGDSVEMEMAALLSPALIKETTGSNAFGPLQMFASNYSMWKIDKIQLRLTPLVGASAVSGSAVRASLNMAGAPSVPSWSALGARKHVDTNPGRMVTWTLTARDIPGPKNGWFYTSTKNEAGFAVGGSIEVHTLGKTMSTYKNEEYKGPLFLAEVTGTWRFKNYDPQPGLLNLVKKQVTEPAGQVKIHSKPGEPVTLSIPAGQTFAGLERLDVQASATPSEIIWEIVDSAARIVTGTLPVPWAWLFQAGWFFVKRIANPKLPGSDSVPGEPDGGEVTFQVFASIADAQNGVPCIATSTAETVSASTEGMCVNQITPGAIGLSEVDFAPRGGAPQPHLGPYDYVGALKAIDSVDREMYSLWGVYDNTHTQQTGVFPGDPSDHDTHSIYWSMCTVHLPGDFEQDGLSIDPTVFIKNTFPISLWSNSSNSATKLGDAVGVNDHRARYTSNSGIKVLSITNVLWRATTTTTWSYSASRSFQWITTKDLLEGGSSSGKLPIIWGNMDKGPEGAHTYSASIKTGELYVTSWLQYSPNSWLSYNGVNFPREPQPWPGESAFPITSSDLQAGLWGSTTLRFYPIGTQPPPIAPTRAQDVHDGLVDSDSDTDYDNDYSSGDSDSLEPPLAVLEDMTFKGRNLYNELWSRGVPETNARKAGQAYDPSPAFRRWQATLKKALRNGSIPRGAHELAIGELMPDGEDRGHAE